jgi:hypothetical protein
MNEASLPCAKKKSVAMGFLAAERSPNDSIGSCHYIKTSSNLIILRQMIKLRLTYDQIGGILQCTAEGDTPRILGITD